MKALTCSHRRTLPDGPHVFSCLAANQSLDPSLDGICFGLSHIGVMSGTNRQIDLQAERKKMQKLHAQLVALPLEAADGSLI